jgi:hypothetical protein
MRRPVALLAAAAAAVTVLLGGCAENPQVAATVGGQVITADEVTAATAAVVAQVEAMGGAVTAADAQPEIFGWYLDGALADAIAAATGVTISDTDLQAAAAQYTDVPLYLADPASHDATAGLLRLEVISSQLQSGALDANAAVAAILNLDVQLNPRYGTWSAEDWLNGYFGSGTSAGGFVNAGYGLAAPLTGDAIS